MAASRWRERAARLAAFAGIGSAREQRLQLWAAISRAGRLQLAAAVFALFATLGFLTDITSLGRAPVGRMLLLALVSGGFAAVYLWAAFEHRRWLPALILAHVLITLAVPRFWPAGPPIVDEPATAALLTDRLLYNVLGVSTCIAATYVLFITFFAREGHRYYALSAELALARDIHRELVPPIALERGGFAFAGISLPSGDVGGDLVDVVEEAGGGGGWTAYVADVSGHGVPSGVLMGMVKSAVRTKLTERVALGALLDAVNDVLHHLSQPNMFVTFAALRPVAPDRLEFALAGHLPILCVRAATGRVEELSLPQIPLGVLPAQRFASAGTSCAPGDLFVVLTDGLTEVFDAADREFGLEGIRAVLETNAGGPLEALRDRLLDAARAHGTQLDDQSIVLVRRRL